jgi:hypothetical protein
MKEEEERNMKFECVGPFISPLPFTQHLILAVTATKVSPFPDIGFRF